MSGGVKSVVVLIAVIVLIFAWVYRRYKQSPASKWLGWNCDWGFRGTPAGWDDETRSKGEEAIVVFLLGSDSANNARLAQRMLSEAACPASVRFVLPPGAPPSLDCEPVGLAGLPARRCCSLSKKTFFIACGPSVFRMVQDWDNEVRRMCPDDSAILSHSLSPSRRASASPAEPVAPLKTCTRPKKQNFDNKNKSRRRILLPCHELFFGWGNFGRALEKSILCWENNPWWGLVLSVAAAKENKEIYDVGSEDGGVSVIAFRGPDSRPVRWGRNNSLGVLRARVDRIAGKNVIFSEDEDISVVQLAN